MTPNQAAKQLEAYNLWRRDNEGIHPMPDPKESGKAIDKAIEILKNQEQ